MCQLGYDKLHFPEFPPCMFLARWTTRDICTDLGPESEATAICSSYYCSSTGLSCWHGTVARPTSAPPSHESFPRFSNFQARYMMKGESFSCRISIPSKSKTVRTHMLSICPPGFQLMLVGSSLCLLFPTLHLSSLPGCLP